MRTNLSNKYVQGRGIEIGALHCPTHIPPGASVTYVDRDPVEVRASHSDVQIAVKDWVVDDATELNNFELDSQDFIMAHHVFEHLTNPIRAFMTWTDRLKPGGVLIFSIPNKDHCFDRPRPITSFAHIMADWHIASDLRDYEHYLDWYMNSELERKPIVDAERLSLEAWRSRRNIHFHVWDAAAAIDMVANLMTLFPAMSLLETTHNGAEMIFVLRKK